MRRVRVGRTDVHLSAVGVGTCQLRLVPERQAMDTVRAALDAGVDWFHASPDYQDADELVARAIAESGREAFVLGDGSGSMEHFEGCYERALRLNGGGPLPMWGISCIDDQEFVGHDVWGPRGMVEFLLAERARGRIRALYCTTHAPADRLEPILRTGVFDAVMLAWNPLGFHVLSSYGEAEGKDYEDLAETERRIFPLAEELGVSLLVMKALGGGLLTRSRAFPTRALLSEERFELRARDVLRHVLGQPGVTAVVPGAAAPEEAVEDALAGHGPPGLGAGPAEALETRVAAMRTQLCSRCGECESTCSQGLPVSWLFRDAYMWLNPADTFDAVPRLDHRHLLGGAALACLSCEDRSCLCPAGLDIPAELPRAMDALGRLRAAGVLPLTPAELERSAAAAEGQEPRPVVVQQERPDRGTWRLWLENAGERPWLRAPGGPDHVEVQARWADGEVERVRLRADCHPGARVHVALDPPRRAGARLFLVAPGRGAEALLAPAGDVPKGGRR